MCNVRGVYPHYVLLFSYLPTNTGPSGMNRRPRSGAGVPPQPTSVLLQGQSPTYSSVFSALSSALDMVVSRPPPFAHERMLPRVASTSASAKRLCRHYHHEEKGVGAGGDGSAAAFRVRGAGRGVAFRAGCQRCHGKGPDPAVSRIPPVRLPLPPFLFQAALENGPPQGHPRLMTSDNCAPAFGLKQQQQMPTSGEQAYPSMA